jgi:hypothetical protein
MWTGLSLNQSRNLAIRFAKDNKIAKEVLLSRYIHMYTLNFQIGGCKFMTILLEFNVVPHIYVVVIMISLILYW